MIRPDSAARRDAGDSDADVKAWLQQLASDDPIDPDDAPAPAAADSTGGVPEAGGAAQDGPSDDAAPPARRGWRARRASRRAANEARSQETADQPDTGAADDAHGTADQPGGTAGRAGAVAAPDGEVAGRDDADASGTPGGVAGADHPAGRPRGAAARSATPDPAGTTSGHAGGAAGHGDGDGATSRTTGAARRDGVAGQGDTSHGIDTSGEADTATGGAGQGGPTGNAGGVPGRGDGTADHTTAGQGDATGHVFDTPEHGIGTARNAGGTADHDIGAAGNATRKPEHGVGAARNAGGTAEHGVGAAGHVGGAVEQGGDAGGNGAEPGGTQAAVHEAGGSDAAAGRKGARRAPGTRRASSTRKPSTARKPARTRDGQADEHVRPTGRAETGEIPRVTEPADAGAAPTQTAPPPAQTAPQPAETTALPAEAEAEAARHAASAGGAHRAPDRRRAPAGPPADGTRGVAARLAALSEFVSAAEERVPARQLAAARELVGRAGERLELTDRYTVVVLAGTTGSGKSSLFNALSGLDLSRVGVRRPTTGELHACVWDPDGAEELLDWLGVPERRRTVRESVLDGDAQKALRGLVLLDLPDFDSIEEAHRAEVDRLVGVVDLVIWVVDPQKYADRTLHEKYLSPLVARESSTAVVLNQIDKLTPDDAQQCAADLGRLLVEDGLRATPLHLTSARTRAGVAELRGVLASAVSDRQASVRRIEADLAAVSGGLAELTGPDGTDALAAEERAGAELPDRLAELAGVPGLLDTSEQDFRRRGRRATGWLFVRWALGGRDPSRQLEQERYDLDWLEDPATKRATARPVPAAGSAERRASRRLGLTGVLRGYLDAAAGTLPATWLGAARTAVATHASALVERLSRLASRARATRPGWWLGMTVAQWVLGGCAVAGGLWLLAAALAEPMGWPTVPTPYELPLLLLLGGLGLGVLLALVSVPLVRAGAREYRRTTEADLRQAVADAATECVRGPVRTELSAYERARAALRNVHSGQ